ncbi:5-hydroxytryptamine receptor 3A-like isoform X1 [Trematomus bernacchii]|uniref:5-hydroxytryptamine receptor 3A-like isoform X1 n=1 Tax=Trematomus bernacchii TaxID=40690 RepID=UPI00146F6478|nr:5-hydroxytryptamine receptor 3A-like isoform X1 [Trematomus bernacchii]
MNTVILALLVLVLVVGSQGGSTNNNSKDDNNNGPCDHDRKKSKFPYEDVLTCLDLTDNKLVRPAKDYKKPTWVYVQMSILAILDVKEIDQTFVSFVWIYMIWEDPHIYWKPHHFDGLDKMTVPTDLLWKPDLMIEEMIEKDKDIPNPFITIHSNGFVEHVRNLMVVSSCKMQVYKFPFDSQRCTLSLKSIIYPEEELKFQFFENDTRATEWTREMMRNESEWLYMGMKVEHQFAPRFHQNQSVVIYTITMKRRSLLYVVNFLVPVLLLFGLDFASFVISDSGGEKLGFEVTLLLAVTVMQLILNDILPCSSDSIPLIAVYCIGIFGLMMVSLLETILVMYLIEKDSASKEKKADKNRSLSEDSGDKQGNYDGDVKKWTRCACVCNVSDEPPSELLSVAKEDKRSQLMEESNSLEKHPDELSEAVKGLSLLLSRKEGRKPDYWTGVAKELHRIFFFVYVTVSALFLVVIFSLWITAEDE